MAKCKVQGDQMTFIQKILLSKVSVVQKLVQFLIQRNREGKKFVATKGGLQIIVYNCLYKRGCYRATIWRVGICLFY